MEPWARFSGASGSHQGLTAKQWAMSGNPIPWEVVVLCASSEDKVKAFEALSTTIDTHGALDLLDIQDVADSWSHAGAWNSAER